jgi:hypothetical protein
MVYIRRDTRSYQHRPIAELNQATAVQNTWYPVLATTYDIEVKDIIAYITVANETLEIEATIDGIVMTATIAATFNNSYYCYVAGQIAAWTMFSNLTNVTDANYSSPLRCKSFSLRARKTTAAGAGTLRVIVAYRTLA